MGFPTPQFAGLFTAPVSLVLIVSGALVSRVAASTSFVDGPGDCNIVGDADVFGLGVRLNYYLQWAAIIFATWIAPEQVQPARLTSNIVTISVYVNTFRGVTYGSLIAAEWWIVYFMTFVLMMGAVPASKVLLGKPVFRFGFLGLLWSMIIFAECWLWFKGLDIGRKEGCTIKIFFLFFQVDVYNENWRMFFKIESVIACITAAIFLLVGLFHICTGAFLEKHDGRRSNRSLIYKQKVGLTAFQVIFGAFAILQIEMTIKINNIDVSATPLTSSGQLIPLTTGIFTLAATFGAGFNHRLGNSQ